MTTSLHPDLLRDDLRSAREIAKRLVASVDRIVPLFPLDAARVGQLSDDEVEQLAAFLHGFALQGAAIQDHVGRAVLLGEEERVAEGSRKDQRLHRGVIRLPLTYPATPGG